MVTKGCGPIHLYGEYSQFVGRTVLRVEAEVEIAVHGFAVNLMAHCTNRFTVDVKEGKMVVAFEPHSEGKFLMDTF
jgi:hypothetical protein